MKPRRLPTSRVALYASLLAALSLLAVPSAEAAAPAWKVTVTPSADYFLPGPSGEENVYTIEAENTGTAPTSGPIRLEDTLPTGLSAAGVRFFASSVGFNPHGDELAEKGYCPSFLKCEFPGTPALAHGEKLVMLVLASVPAAPDPSGPLADVAKVSGGGPSKAVLGTATNQAATSPPLGFHSFEAPLTDSAAAPYTQAAGHPYQLLTEFIPTTRAIPHLSGGDSWGYAGYTPVADPREIVAELPPGLIGDPQAVPRCQLAEFVLNECPISTVVGSVGLKIEPPGTFQGGLGTIVPLFNLEPAGEFPGELGYAPVGSAYFLTAGLRSGSDYGIDITSAGLPPVDLTQSRVTTWGVPAAPEHDPVRGAFCIFTTASEFFIQSAAQLEQDCGGGDLGNLHGGPAGVPPTPFLTMPSQCSGQPLGLGMRYDVWQNEEKASASYENPAVDGCGTVHFEPRLEALPTTNLADAPSGLAFDLHVPQGCWKEEAAPDFEPLCQSDLQEAVVKLPAGLAVNPASANGLAACSPAQIGLTSPVGQTPAHFTESPATCPNASKLGSAEVKTPLLHETLGATPGETGSVYLATPHQNPFESLLAAYIVLEGHGLIVKLPGKIEVDPSTGQITGKFLENPQTPFEDLHLTFFGGARGDLRTPAICGSYKTTSQLTPYSHLEGETEATPIAEPASEFETTNGGASCPHQASEEPNAPAFRAGTESPQAGQFSPFAFKLRRADGSQEFSKIETTLPPGLVGRLAGVGECSEAQLAVAKSREREGGGAEEQASPSCPANSEVGTVEVAAGAGPTPYYTQGKVYLAGPYTSPPCKAPLCTPPAGPLPRAPLSLAIITPAVAGPFDLGDVLVRTALYVEPETAQIKAVSDPIPHILDGIPLDVKSITLKMDRSNFTLNPTNCNELHFAGAETSVLESTAPLAQRFQVGGCSVLPFRPKLKLSLRGKTTRTGHPALKAVLTMKPGEANIARAQVTLPHSEFLDQAHIGTSCTRVQFAEGNGGGEKCPPASIYGHAKAWSPLLDKPLEGPVYLRASNHELPDLVAALNGQIQIALDGRVDSVNARLRNTFEVVPDAPVSKFVLEMQGNRKGLLVNSTNICAAKAKNRAIADFTGQNGKVWDTEPVVKAKCPKGGRGKGHGHHRKHHGRRG